MRFSDFLRTTVLISAAAASALAAVTVAAAAGTSDDLLVPVSAGWWVIAGMIGIWIGRRAGTTSQIASLLASARTQASLPEVNPARTVLNRLWPLLFSTIGAGALAFLRAAGAGGGDRLRDHLVAGLAPPGVGGDRDRGTRRRALLRRAARRPLKPIRLIRTPGFRSNLFELNGASGHSRRARPRA